MDLIPIQPNHMNPITSAAPMKLIGICTLIQDAVRYSRTAPGSVVTEYVRKDGSRYYTIKRP